MKNDRARQVRRLQCVSSKQFEGVAHVRRKIEQPALWRRVRQRRRALVERIGRNTAPVCFWITKLLGIPLFLRDFPTHRLVGKLCLVKRAILVSLRANESTVEQIQSGLDLLAIFGLRARSRRRHCSTQSLCEIPT